MMWWIAAPAGWLVVSAFLGLLVGTCIRAQGAGDEVAVPESTAAPETADTETATRAETEDGEVAGHAAAEEPHDAPSREVGAAPVR